jgi:hypothetical protein
MSRFGKRGDAVQAFVDEVSATAPDRWQEVFAASTPTPEVLAAAEALREVGLSASVSSAIDSATRTAFRGLGLRKEDFRAGIGVSGLLTDIQYAASALAVGDALAPEHRRVLLEPFRATGFRSVADEPA